MIFIAGVIVGFAEGRIKAILGIPPEAYHLAFRILGQLFGMGSAVFISGVLSIRWLLAARFGTLRLVLVRAEAANDSIVSVGPS